MKIKVSELHNFISEDMKRINNKDKGISDNIFESGRKDGQLRTYSEILTKIENMVSDELDEMKKIIENENNRRW